MDKYIDLVVCNDGQIIHGVYQAPAWSGLEKGDEVIVDGEKERLIVERTYTVGVNGAELDFILTASGTKLPLKKILKKVFYKEFEYVEDEA